MTGRSAYRNDLAWKLRSSCRERCFEVGLFGRRVLIRMVLLSRGLLRFEEVEAGPRSSGSGKGYWSGFVAEGCSNGRLWAVGESMGEGLEDGRQLVDGSLS